MALPVGDEDEILPEPVEHHADHPGLSPEGNGNLLAPVHSEMLLGIVGGIKSFLRLAALSWEGGENDLPHLIHPVMAQLPLVVVKGGQIVIFVVPDQAEGGDGIAPALLPEDLLLFHVIVEVFKGNDLLCGDGHVEFIDIVINALVHGLDPAADIDLSLKLPGLMAAGQLLQLADKGVTLSLGNEAGGLHRVHKQLQLGQFKVPLPDEPARPPTFPGLDVHPHEP